jgi:hypothetical protein
VRSTGGMTVSGSADVTGGRCAGMTVSGTADVTGRRAAGVAVRRTTGMAVRPTRVTVSSAGGVAVRNAADRHRTDAGCTGDKADDVGVH